MQSGKWGQVTEGRAASIYVDGTSRHYILQNCYETIRSLTHRATVRSKCIHLHPNSVAARSVLFCDRLNAGIASSNVVEDMDVRLVCWLCFVWVAVCATG